MLLDSVLALEDGYMLPENDGASRSDPQWRYTVLTGTTTVFSGPEGTRQQDILDGTKRTLLIVEAERSIPWTKPEDVPYTRDAPVPKLGGLHHGGSYAAFADGGVRWISDTISPETLRKLCTKAGKEPLGDWP